MNYNILVKNKKQLSKKHYKDYGGDWHRNKFQSEHDSSLYIFASEVGQVFVDMKRVKNGFDGPSALDEDANSFIPTWAVFKFLDYEKESMYFV